TGRDPLTRSLPLPVLTSTTWCSDRERLSNSKLMPDPNSYVIRGGIDGRERLKLLSRIMHPSTAELFDRAGISPGIKCLEIGCGSGDMSLELARRVGAGGQVLGVDIDLTKIELARREAA